MLLKLTLCASLLPGNGHWSAISNKRSCPEHLVTTSTLWLIDLQRKTPWLRILQLSAPVICSLLKVPRSTTAWQNQSTCIRDKSCWQSTDSAGDFKSDLDQVTWISSDLEEEFASLARSIAGTAPLPDACPSPLELPWCTGALRRDLHSQSANMTCFLSATWEFTEEIIKMEPSKFVANWKDVVVQGSNCQTSLSCKVFFTG